MTLQRIQSAAVFPQRLNDGVDLEGSKGAVLSRETLSLVRSLIAPLERGPIRVICDKHGGRNRYGPLLQTTFPEYVIEVVQESRPLSIYRWGPNDRRVEFRFRAQGESFLPAALASITSKYLRELAMRAFNQFWCRQVIDLQPTAGYPVDARRFKAHIQARQHQLGISDRVLWRNR